MFFRTFIGNQSSKPLITSKYQDNEIHAALKGRKAVDCGELARGNGLIERHPRPCQDTCNRHSGEHAAPAKRSHRGMLSKRDTIQILHHENCHEDVNGLRSPIDV